VDAVGQHLGMLDGHLASSKRPSRTGQRAAVQRPGGADRAASTGGTKAQGGAQPAGGRGGLHAGLGAGGAARVHRREAAQPGAVELVGQPPQRQDIGGQLGVAEPGRVVGGQLGDGRSQPFQPSRERGRLAPPHQRPTRDGLSLASRTSVRVHAATLPGPATTAQAHQSIWGQPNPHQELA
jgi:hypothetical protein